MTDSVPSVNGLVVWLLLAGAASAANPQARLWVRLVDERGAPTAARIDLRDATGKAYVPSGSLARQASSKNETFFHAYGHFQLDMPPGEATVEAVKGFEYTPVTQRIELKSGQTSVASLALKRWIDLPALGWYSGDVHMHPNHVLGGLYMTMQDCRLYTQAED